MYRGTRKFKCHDCGHIFVGADIEWNATPLSAPLTCPKCGKKRTAPYGSLLNIFNQIIYRIIWQQEHNAKRNSDE